MKAFQTALVHDLDEAGFADMYAQTIAYGLLSARITDPERRSADDLASHMRTNPFLKELMETFLHVGGRRGTTGGQGIDFDELGVSEVLDLMDHANMEAVVCDFGDRNPQEDPVIHFYEHFLAAYDKKQKVSRGVFYTPRPVVSYIVRSVDELLRTEFGLEDGFADTTTWGEMVKRCPPSPTGTGGGGEGLKIPDGTSPDQTFVQILDPATGTGTFLVEVIDLIHKTLVAKWKAQGQSDKKIDALWNEYVPKHLLPRLHGYELLMAPYAIAHLKIGLKLYETGYRFGSDERARVFLTNALEPPTDIQFRITALPALAHEAQAVNEIKRKQRFTSVIGNPPYSQYSMNLNDEAKAHIEKFRYANGQRIRARNALQLERNLNDDYVKFLGFSSGLLPPSTGILGMITNRMYLDSESLVGLREWFATNFEQILVLDLWGSSEEARRVARLAEDENVFDILQGVAVSFFVRRRSTGGGPCRVVAREVVGKREEKYQLLVENLRLGESAWKKTRPSPEAWWLHRIMDSGPASREFTLSDIFPHFSTLVASNRDHLVVGMDPDIVLRNVAAVKTFQGANEELARQVNITLKAGWNITAARKKLKDIRDLSECIASIEYRPFDRRWIFFHPTLVWQTAPVISVNVMKDSPNRVLISLGKNRAETLNGQWVSNRLADKSVVSTRDNASGFPLYLHLADGGLRFSEETRLPNLSTDFLKHLSARLNVGQSGPFGLPNGVSPEQILHYIYALLFSPGYRSRYATLPSACLGRTADGWESSASNRWTTRAIASSFPASAKAGGTRYKMTHPYTEIYPEAHVPFASTHFAQPSYSVACLPFRWIFDPQASVAHSLPHQKGGVSSRP
jgi:predicted helicase